MQEFQQAETTELSHKPVYSFISFLFGLFGFLILLYTTYLMVGNISSVVNKSEMDGNSAANLSRSLIRSIFFIIPFYFVSLACLIAAQIKKEKSVFKVIAFAGHILICFLIAFNLVKEMLS